MDHADTVRSLWESVHRQRWDALPGYFCPGAVICWPNTGERFTVEEYVRANSEYPGDWAVAMERLEVMGELAVSVIRTVCGSESLHAVSFFRFDGDSIASLEEYWGEDAPPPRWRTDKQIGRAM